MRSDESLGSVIAALAANTAIAVAKGAAAALTGSPALFAETLHTRPGRTRRALGSRLVGESPDPTVVTVFFEDTIDVLGALLALVALVLHHLTGSGVPDALASIVIGALLCYLASRLTRRNRELLTNQSLPERYVQRLGARLESRGSIDTVTRLEAVYLGPTEVLVAADVRMADGLTGAEVAAALADARADLAREVPAIARLYITPVGDEAPQA
jgi:divalent metal cation (Fe/Co/Zn/Cd) transporter